MRRREGGPADFSSGGGAAGFSAAARFSLGLVFAALEGARSPLSGLGLAALDGFGEGGSSWEAGLGDASAGCLGAAMAELIWDAGGSGFASRVSEAGAYI